MRMCGANSPEITTQVSKDGGVVEFASSVVGSPPARVAAGTWSRRTSSSSGGKDAFGARDWGWVVLLGTGMAEGRGLVGICCVKRGDCSVLNGRVAQHGCPSVHKRTVNS